MSGATSSWGFNMTPAPAGAGATPAEPTAGEPCQPCLAAQRQRAETVRIRVSLYFDGTLNNRGNSSNRDSPFATEGTSYLNDVSNVGILEDCGLSSVGPGADHHLSIYVEGIGTITGGEDSQVGAGTGMRGTGIYAKVERGINAAAQNIARLAGSKRLVWVHVDSFGFSRGAAAARNCVYQIFREGVLRERLTDAGHPPGQIVCQFVGLFDTVASYGVAHFNDTWELGLDCLAVAAKVVQLAAAEEHRANFRLTNIASAGGNGEEHFLPGVHSDIGGGYVDNASEDILVFDLDLLQGRSMSLDPTAVAVFDAESAWLTSRGWYTPAELTKARRGAHGVIQARKARISNKYGRIPLQLMGEFARRHGVPIGGDLEREHALPAGDAVLRQANVAIRERVNSRSDSTPGAWFTNTPASDPAWHKQLRHGYLHFSALYGATMGAHDPERHPLRRGYGRHRIIQNG